MKRGEIKKFEVFVLQLCTGNIIDAIDGSNPPNLVQIKNIIDQLFDGLKQLKNANACHNDLKPKNILYDRMNDGRTYKVYIADFGQCEKTGGTPGWTAPVFHRPRSFRDDIYSIGLICLRLLCNSQHYASEQNRMLFKCLKNNFIRNEDQNQPWFVDFRGLPQIKFVYELINLKNETLTLEMAIEKWSEIKQNVKFIDKQTLLDLEVPETYLTIQYESIR